VGGGVELNTPFADMHAKNTSFSLRFCFYKVRIAESDCLTVCRVRMVV